MPGAIGIPSSSAFFPSDRHTADILHVQWIELAFYHRPIDPTKFSPFDARTDQPNQSDIRARLTSEPGQPLLLHYYGTKEDLQIRGSLVTDPEEWMLSQNVLSIQDVAEGQLFISLGPVGRTISDGGGMDWFPERQHFYFTRLYLRISKRTFEIEGSDLTQYRTAEQFPYWCYRFRHATQAGKN